MKSRSYCLNCEKYQVVNKQTRAMETSKLFSKDLKSGDPNLDVLWSQNPQTLQEILNENKLPIIVKICTDSKVSSTNSSASDIHKPLVLYKDVRGKKVYAKNVTSVDVLTGAVCREDGPVVVIPICYEGWFRLIDDIDKPLTTVANVARIMPVRFLSCKPVSGFLEIEKASNGTPDSLYEKLFINPGVYSVQNIYEDFVRYVEKKKTVKNLMRCLKCSMDDGTEFLLPFDSDGCFYLIETRKTSSKRLNVEKYGYVYSIHSMLEAGMSKNVIVSLLFGKPPTTPCGFTNVMKICDVIRDHTVIACTLTTSKKLLELPVAPMPKFVKAMNLDKIQTSVLYTEIQNHLNEHAENYVRELKVRHNYNVQAVKKRTESPSSGNVEDNMKQLNLSKKEKVSEDLQNTPKEESSAPKTSD